MKAGSVESPATVGEWLARLTPEPPHTLSARLHSSLRDHLDEPLPALPELCIGAAEKLLAQLLESGGTSRDTALDLLAVDALVTYAFENASESQADIDSLAADAMKRIAAFPGRENS